MFTWLRYVKVIRELQSEKSTPPPKLHFDEPDEKTAEAAATKDDELSDGKQHTEADESEPPAKKSRIT